LQEQTIIPAHLVWNDYKKTFFTVCYRKKSRFQSVEGEKISDLVDGTGEKAPIPARRIVALLTAGAPRVIFCDLQPAAGSRT
jgi:hypothetical protein